MGNNQPMEDVKLPEELQNKITKAEQRLAITEQETLVLKEAKAKEQDEIRSLIKQKEELGVEIEEYQYKLDKIDEDYKSSSILLKDKNIRLEAVVKETAELVEINKKRTLELDEHKRDIKELESGLNVREGIVVKKEQRLNKLEESIKIKENLLKEVLEKI